MKKLVQSLFILMFVAVAAIAQERTVTGTVISAEDGLPLPGVSVAVKGTTTGTQTNGNGQFSLRITTPNPVLVFSFIGTTTQEIAVPASNVVDVKLATDAAVLNEVVVTALGLERQKRDLGYAAATISNDDLTQASAVTVANGLQGKVSGLNVTTVNSGVFDEVKINLRGIRSLTGNNNPLLVIDGIPSALSFLSSINPNDIENVSVLKGSSAAAIYGPDARNGVIIVTTKKSAKGDQPVITVGNSTQFQNISFFPKLQKQFGNGAYGEYVGYENWSWGPAYDGSTVKLGRPLADGSQETGIYSGTDEREKFFDTGSIVQNDISFAAKDFYLSVQDANIRGIVPGDKNRRTGIRLNTSREYGKFRAGINVNYIQQNYKVFNDDAMSDYFTSKDVGGNDGLMNLIFSTPAHIKITSYKDFRNNPFAEYNGYYNDYGSNPYFALDNWRREGKTDDLLTNLDLNYKATDWLNFTYRAGLTSKTITDREFSRGETPTEFGLSRSFDVIPGAIEERAYKSTRISSEIFGTANKDLSDDFKIGGILGSYLRQNDIRDTRVGASNLVVPELFNIGNRTGELTGSSPGSRSRLFSVYSSVNLGFRNWANVEVTGRNDWTSVLGLNNNSFFYPGVSAAVVLTDAVPALKSDNGLLSYLKLRGAWNKTGNADINPYLLAATFSQPDGFPFGSLPGYTANDTTYDPELEPEFIDNTEFGFESSFWNGRINFDATYFYQNNTNQIVNIRVSDATGYNFASVNAASFINKGVELDLRLTPLIKFNDGGVEFRANATYLDSEVTSVYAGLDEISLGGYVKSGNYAVVGMPAFMIKATDYLRDDQGRIIVDRFSGYPTEDPNTKFFGRTMPKWIIGLSPSVYWKNFNLSAVAEYKGGYNSSFFAMGSDMAWTGVSAATAINNRERFVIPNSSYEDPANPGNYIANTDVTVSNVNDYFTGVFKSTASNFITSAAAWRLREVALSYNVPTKFLSKQNVVKGATIALTGRNLFIWVPETNEFTDPDFNSYSDTNNITGIIDSQINPPTRTFGFSVNLRF